MLSRENDEYYSEAEMLADAKKLMEKHKYIFLMCSSTNLDSLATFYQAGQSQIPKRKMYANYYVYEQLKNFRETAGNRTKLYNFQNIEPIMFNHVSNLPNGETITQKERMKKYGFITIIKGTEFYEKWIESFQDCEEKPVVVYSMWDGYIRKGTKAYDENLAKFCEKYNAIPMHTSGHIYPKDLEKVIKTVAPREAIIPIHTENAEGMKKLDIPNYLKRKIKYNISEYEGEEKIVKNEDSRKVSEEMMYELEKGRFCEFVKFVKENQDPKLALCFRGNTSNESDNVTIYYNNHKVWELIKDGDDYYVKISFNHARYTEDWKGKLETLCQKYHFKDGDYKNIDINNVIKRKKNKRSKSNNSYQYSIGYLITKNEIYNKEFVQGTFDIIIALMKDFFNEEKIVDYFRLNYEGVNYENRRKNKYLEKQRQQELYLELDNGELKSPKNNQF